MNISANHYMSISTNHGQVMLPASMPEEVYTFASKNRKDKIYYYRIEGKAGQLSVIDRIKTLFHFFVAVPFSERQKSLWREFYYGKREFVIVFSPKYFFYLHSNISRDKLIQIYNEAFSLGEQELFSKWLNDHKGSETELRIETAPPGGFQQLAKAMPRLNRLVMTDVHDLSGIGLLFNLKRLRATTSQPLSTGALKEICQLKKLEELFLAENQLTELPSSIGELSALKNLYLFKNQITTLPDSFGQLSQLELVHLSQNQLTELPSSFGKLSALKKLQILGNQITTLPDSFGQLSKLEEANFMHNRLKTLPESFGKLSKLTKLNLASNLFEKVPECLYSLPKTCTVDLEDNRLSEEEIVALVERISQPNYAGPNFNSSDITKQLQKKQNILKKQQDEVNAEKFSKWLSSFLKSNKEETVTELQIKDSFPMESFQQLVEYMPQLKDLYFLVNLDALPDEICQLQELRSLYLTKKQLKELPSDIGQLSKLEVLHLGGNFLEELPESFENLSSLTELTLWENRLRYLPDSFGKLAALETLDLSGNELSRLPDSFKNLLALSSLDLSYNQLTFVPEFLYSLPQSCDICLKGNPFNPLFLNDLKCRMQDPNYNGPFFYFSDEELQQRNVRPLSFSKLLKSWGYQNSQALSDIIDEKQKNSIINWLMRLVDTEDYKENPIQIQALVHLTLDCLVQEPQSSERRVIALSIINNGGFSSFIWS